MKPKFIVMNTLIAVFMVNALTAELISRNTHAAAWVWAAMCLWIMALDYSMDVRRLRSRAETEDKLHMDNLTSAYRDRNEACHDRNQALLEVGRLKNMIDRSEQALKVLTESKLKEVGLNFGKQGVRTFKVELAKGPAPIPSPLSKKLKVKNG